MRILTWHWHDFTTSSHMCETKNGHLSRGNVQNRSWKKRLVILRLSNYFCWPAIERNLRRRHSQFLCRTVHFVMFLLGYPIQSWLLDISCLILRLAFFNIANTLYNSQIGSGEVDNLPLHGSCIPFLAKHWSLMMNVMFKRAQSHAIKSQLRTEQKSEQTLLNGKMLRKGWN